MPDDFTNSDPVERISSYAIEDLDFMLLYEQVESSKFEVLIWDNDKEDITKFILEGSFLDLIIQSCCGSLIIHAIFGD